MSPVVYLHIGAPKTGTTYLQDRLDRNAASLRTHDVHLPAGPLGQTPSATHFKAALDLTEMDWGGPPGHAKGQWDALVRRIRRLEGTVIVSHEILASAKPEQVARAREDLEGTRLHLVYSARDLGRQIPAMWQESIKQGRRWSFKKYLRDLQTKPSGNFWRSQRLPDVLTRWSEGLSPGNVHLVTVPQPSSPKDLLWRRFCAAFGIDPAWAPEGSERTNPSMGVVETALVRSLNRRLRRTDIDREERRQLVKDILVQQNLARRGATQRATLPPPLHSWAHEITEEWVEWVNGSGIDVIGDVADLRTPPPAVEAWLNPDRPDSKLLAEAAIDALSVMTLEAARRVPAEAQLTQRVGRAVRRVRGQ